MMGTLLLVVLILLLVGAFPAYSYNRHWSYRPSGVVTLILVVVIFLILFGRL